MKQLIERLGSFFKKNKVIVSDQEFSIEDLKSLPDPAKHINHYKEHNGNTS